MQRHNAKPDPALLRLHAEDGAFVAALRRRAVDGPSYRLIDVYDLESRLHGHLDALHLSGDDGAAAAADAADSDDAGYGEVFVAAHAAFRRQDQTEIARLRGVAAASSDRAEAVAEAAAWCEPAVVAAHVRGWIAAPDPASGWLALHVCGARRVDPREHLARLLGHPEPLVAARAARLAAETGRSDLAPAVLRAAGDEPRAAFWAAWAAALLGDRSAAPDRLSAALGAGLPAPLARRAAELLPLVAPPETCRRIVRDLLDDDATARWAMVAVGSLGGAETLDWLVRQMDDPALARLAGASFGLITGARLGPDNLELDTFPEEPDEPAPDDAPPDDAPPDDARQERFIDANLYWPDPAKVGAWLAANRARFRPDTRHLLGQPAWSFPDPPDLPARYQLEFRAAAIELATRRPNAPLPNWRAPVILSAGSFTRQW